jgi:hypothetical protein
MRLPARRCALARYPVPPVPIDGATIDADRGHIQWRLAPGELAVGETI